MFGHKPEEESKEESKRIYNSLRKFKKGKIIVIERTNKIPLFRVNAMFEVVDCWGWRGVKNANALVLYLTQMIRVGVVFRLATNREALLFYTHGRDALIEETK